MGVNEKKTNKLAQAMGPDVPVYATNETDVLIAAPFITHRLVGVRRICAKKGVLSWLRPDAKVRSRCVVETLPNKPVAVDAVVAFRGIALRESGRFARSDS